METVAFMQRVGHSNCIRCNYQTSDDMSFADQDAAIHAHLTEKHPDWMTTPLTPEQMNRSHSQLGNDDMAMALELLAEYRIDHVLGAPEFSCKCDTCQRADMLLGRSEETGINAR